MALMQHERRACLGIAEVVNGGNNGFAFFVTQPFWSHHGALLSGKMQDQEGVARLVGFLLENSSASSKGCR